MKPLLLLIACLLIASPALAQTPEATWTPTPTPTVIPLPAQEIFGAIATANAGVSTIGGDLSAPNGVPLLPATDGREVWGYAKWLISPVGAEDLFGPFSPIFISLGVYVTMSFSLTAIYLIILIGSILLRVILGIYRLISQSAVSLVIFVVILAIGVAVAWIVANFAAVSAWWQGVVAAIQSFLEWVASVFEAILEFLGIGGG